jgi:hypothetical protein
MAIELTQHLYYWIVPNSHNLLKLLIPKRVREIASINNFRQLSAYAVTSQ